MTTAKYTPGPWYRDRESGVRCDVRSESGRKIALCWGLSTSKAARANSDIYRAECDANAHLIAAAPDLLDALRQMIVNSEGDGKSYRDCHKKAVAALAKAEGHP